MQKISSFGADIPTTPMMWKKEGNHLEWIVRQMSWMPPWVNDIKNNDALCTAKSPTLKFLRANLNDTSEIQGKQQILEQENDTIERCFNDLDHSCAAMQEQVEALDMNDVSETDIQRIEKDQSLDKTKVASDSNELSHPQTVWRQMPAQQRTDSFGYGRNPAFWFTLNYPYNYVFELHRLQEATRELQRYTRPDQWTHEFRRADKQAMDARFQWTADNSDLVVLMHAIRVELNVRHVMSEVVEKEDDSDFQFWLRFEFGSSGNPHGHGLNYVKGNPSFESVVADEEMRQQLIEAGHHEAADLQTWEEAEKHLARFYTSYVSEKHPGKDDSSSPLFHFYVDLFSKHDHLKKPQTVNLYEMLEKIFEQPEEEPDLQPLRELLLSLIEHGGLHDRHGQYPPVAGVHQCARFKSQQKKDARDCYCRYLFPRSLFAANDEYPGYVQTDPHRPNLRNLYLERNDAFINNFEAHVLLSNLGNIDWRPLINLWSVLEYLTKYTAKSGKGSLHFGKLFEEIIEQIMVHEEEDGCRDLWRKTIMKFYNKLLGNRDYSIFEVLHFGLKLPGTISSFGSVDSCSVSNWSVLKHPQIIKKLEKGERCSELSKLEVFNVRAVLERPSTIKVEDLQNISFYAFWRLYYVNKSKLVKRFKEKFVAINGAGWPRLAKITHKNHAEYAKKTLYAYMPCDGFSGTDYIDDVVKTFYKGSFPAALEAFVHDPLNKWCPTWIRRNYDVQNSDEAHDQDALVIRKKFVFEEPAVDAATQNGSKENSDELLPETDGCPAERTKRIANVQRLPLDQGEPAANQLSDDQHIFAKDVSWSAENREKWQLHSALGPNLNPEGFEYKAKEALQEQVNPLDYDYSKAASGIDVEDLEKRWQSMQEDYPEYTDESLTLDALDEYQLLFVSVVLEYVEKVLEAIDKDWQEPEPLGLMLLGTAGTGKSTATKTLLQELRRRLQGHKLEVDFFKVAAPTGTAAFNVRFNATTLHRLIHWFTPKYWNEELSDVKLDKLQQALGKTELVVIDEISMVGRQMMGRVDSRLSKAKPHREDSTLGGTGLVCVGDPGQCQAMFDQQLYDTNPHSQSKDFTSNAKLSNRGLQIYEECDKYIILNNVHRINVIKTPKSQEDIDYNVRAQEFLRLLHRLRD